MTMLCYNQIFIFIPAFIFLLCSVYNAIRFIPIYKNMLRPCSSIKDAETGRVNLEGTVFSYQKKVIAPSGNQCIWYCCKILPQGYFKWSSRIIRISSSSPFILKDKTGMVVVTTSDKLSFYDYISNFTFPESWTSSSKDPAIQGSSRIYSSPLSYFFRTTYYWQEYRLEEGAKIFISANYTRSSSAEDIQGFLEKNKSPFSGIIIASSQIAARDYLKKIIYINAAVGIGASVIIILLLVGSKCLQL